MVVTPLSAFYALSVVENGLSGRDTGGLLTFYWQIIKQACVAKTWKEKKVNTADISSLDNETSPDLFIEFVYYHSVWKVLIDQAVVRPWSNHTHNCRLILATNFSLSRMFSSEKYHSLHGAQFSTSKMLNLHFAVEKGKEQCLNLTNFKNSPPIEWLTLRLSTEFFRINILRRTKHQHFLVEFQLL